MPKLYLTSEALDALKKELNYLKTIKRAEISERIKSAKELGDLSENAEYADAKEEQSFMEGKILDIEDKINNAVMFKEGVDSSGIVKVGSTIKAKSGRYEMEYTIVGSQEANPVFGKISNESPIGKAFLGKKEGDTINVQTPGGGREYKILEIK